MDLRPLYGDWTAAGDFNGDGLPDLATIEQSGRVGHLALNHSTPPLYRDCNTNGVPDVCEPDCDQDGTPDVCEIRSGEAGDCNRNSIPDACDIASGRSRDRNGNSTPDECEPVPFHRGDANADGLLNIADPVRVLHRLFLDGTPLPCDDAADSNDDGAVQMDDAVTVLMYLFIGGNAPLAPGPPTAACGVDPGADFLDCAEYLHCGG